MQVYLSYKLVAPEQAPGQIWDFLWNINLVKVKMSYYELD